MKIARFFLLFCLLLPLSPNLNAQEAPSVSDARFARLAYGVNLSNWMWGQPWAWDGEYSDSDAYYMETFIRESDAELIAESGFTHVRLPIDPVQLRSRDDHTQPDPEFLAYVDGAIEMFLAHDIAVIVDMHALAPFIKQLAINDDFVQSFAAFWRNLAAHLSQYDPEMVFLEVLNEPAFNTFVDEPVARWAEVQAILLAAMREGAPEHTLIAKGHDWDSIDALLQLEPLADPNIVYNFHFYEPHEFTHQGATWGSDEWLHLRGIPYPMTEETLVSVLPDLSATGQAALNSAGDWDLARMETRIGQAAAWAEEHGVRLTCNEYGVYRLTTENEDRLRWLHDARQVLEQYGIGWAVWDYAGNFGVMMPIRPNRRSDFATLQALDLP